MQLPDKKCKQLGQYTQLNALKNQLPRRAYTPQVLTNPLDLIQQIISHGRPLVKYKISTRQTHRRLHIHR